MAARNPTSFNTWVDMAGMMTGGQVSPTEPTKVLDDQVFILDKAELVVSQIFPAMGANTGTPAYTSFLGNKIYFHTKDMCSADGVTEIDHELYLYACTTSGTTTGNIRATTGASASNIITAVIPAGTTPTWIKCSTLYGYIKCRTNATKEYIYFDIGHRTAGAGYICLLGFALFALET